MPQSSNWSRAEAQVMRLAGRSYREIADHFGVSGESTIREGLRRYTNQTERNAARSRAAAVALSARWGGSSVPTLDRTFGVEIEFHTALRGAVTAAVERVVGYHIHMTSYHGNTCVTCNRTVSGYQHWKLETDSSATSGMSNAGQHPHNQGGELVSPVLKGQRGLDEVKAVMAALRSVGAKVDNRHGMHIHLGVGDINWTQRMTLFKNYKAVQPLLFSLVARSRLHNTYCNPLSTIRIDEWVRFALHGRAGVGSHTDSMNITNIGRIGTIEMRMHQGTLNGKKATEWIKLLIAYFDASRDGCDLDDTETVLSVLKDRGYLTSASHDWLVNRRQSLNPTAVAA